MTFGSFVFLLTNAKRRTGYRKALVSARAGRVIVFMLQVLLQGRGSTLEVLANLVGVYAVAHVEDEKPGQVDGPHRSLKNLHLALAVQRREVEPYILENPLDSYADC